MNEIDVKPKKFEYVGETYEEYLMGNDYQEPTWKVLGVFLGSIAIFCLGVVKFLEIVIAGMKMAGWLNW